MAPVDLHIDDNDVLAAKRDLSVHGVGLVFLVNGFLLALSWGFCWRAMGGALSAHPESLPSLAFNGYSVIAFACLGYILVMDMETALKDGKEAARRITMDWMFCGLLPAALYIACSAYALGLPYQEIRQAAAAQGLLAAALILYGLSLTRMHFPGHAPS